MAFTVPAGTDGHKGGRQQRSVGSVQRPKPRSTVGRGNMKLERTDVR